MERSARARWAARQPLLRSSWLHAGRRFGDVLVSIDADEELNGYFNAAEAQIRMSSPQGGIPEGLDPNDIDAWLARIDARRAARKIRGRLETTSVAQENVLVALYTERSRPWALSRTLHHLAGVVEAMLAVRADHLGERHLVRTAATTTTAWLEGRVARDAELLTAWRNRAVLACERAVGAYQRARGDSPSIAPKGER